MAFSWAWRGKSWAIVRQVHGIPVKHGFYMELQSMPTPAFDLDRFLPYRLSRAAELLSDDFAAFCRQTFEFSWAEWRVMWSLGEGLHSTAKDISGHSGLGKTRISRAIKALEERGWIGRRRDAEDRRLEQVALTAEGRRHYDAMIDLVRGFQTAIDLTLDPAGQASLEEALLDIEGAVAGDQMGTAIIASGDKA